MSGPLAKGVALVALALAVPAFGEPEKESELSRSSPDAATSSWKATATYKFIFPALILANATRQFQKKPDHVLGDVYGPVSVRLKTEAPDSTVVLKTSIDEIAEPTESRFVVDEPGEYTIRPKMEWRYDKLRGLLQPIPVKVSVAATINGTSLGEKKGTMRVLSVNDVPTLIKARDGDVHLEWMFAAFVNEEHPWIDDLLKDAKSTGLVKGFVGYQRGPQEVDHQVQAIYEMLHRRGVTYSSITTNSSPDPAVYSQHVRFLSDSIKNSQANCIDGVVLMASILRKIGIQPIIITGPGHAILGYRPDLKTPKMIHVVETTMIGSAPFPKALAAGTAKFNEWNSKQPHDPQFHEIDVTKARQDGVMPISR